MSALNSEAAGGLFIALMILIILVILPVIVLVQVDIVKPLKELERGARYIGEGNLDFTLRTRSKNEVGRVIHSYEKMRSELKQSIERQVQYENSRKELISSISHDLKTPMTSIKGYVEGILDGVANTEEKRERYLKVIRQKSLDMEKLIDDLFTFSKLDLNQLPMNPEVVKMEKFIRNITEEMELEYQEDASVSMTLDNPSGEEMLVKIDPVQMKRVFVNLIHNSIKYNDKDSKQVELILKGEPEQICVTVRDNGIGMERKELKQAFEIFYRTDESRNTKTGGSGLGLAIVRGIVKRHHGRISAKSDKGSGTSITVELDRYKDEKALKKNN